MLYCSSECGSISIMQLRTICCNTHVHTFHVCLCVLALKFVCNSNYLLKYSFQIYQKCIVVFIRSSKIWFKTTSCAKGPVTRCNFPGNLQRNSTLKRCKLVTNVWYVKNILANCDGNVYLSILHLAMQVYRIALQVGRKIAPCDRALIHVCLAYLFLHSGQVLSSFKCCFKRKYLNLIDSNCDVDECCPWFFIGTVLACHRPWMYYQYICDIEEEKSLWDECSSIVLRVAICCVGMAARNFGNGRVVLCTWETVIASSGLQLLWEGYVFLGGFLCASCII